MFSFGKIALIIQHIKGLALNHKEKDKDKKMHSKIEAMRKVKKISVECAAS